MRADLGSAQNSLWVGGSMSESMGGWVVHSRCFFPCIRVYYRLSFHTQNLALRPKKVTARGKEVDMRVWSLSCRASMERMQVVLVSPKNPQNIGSVLRASGNHGVHRVVVVSPRCDVHEDTVSTVSCDSPARLVSVSSLAEALADSEVSLAFSRRKGKGRRVLPSLTAFLQEAEGDSPGGFDNYGRVALVFGREESGLLDEEVLLCTHTVEIPSDPTFPSLNLSHAVAVILNQVFQYTLSKQDCTLQEESFDTDVLATHAEMDALYSRLKAFLDGLGIDTAESRGGGDSGSHGRRRQALGNLKSLLLRSKATQSEVRSLFKLVKQIEEKAGVSQKK
jgi:TrmH family RNA methyltransferase